jgi:cell filamentation protein
MMDFERETLARLTPCRAGSPESVADAVARVHADLLLIHPFRDGNGRLARWLADLMFAQAGLPFPDYGFVGRGSMGRRKEYLRAVTLGYLGDYAPLGAFFVEGLRRRERRRSALR